MKKFIFSVLTVSGLGLYSQTVSTTTINGSLRVNDSLNVSNNLEAADIKSRGEMTAQSNLTAESDLLVNGRAEILGGLKVSGPSLLLGGALTPSLVIGTATKNIGITLLTLLDGAKVLAFGFSGPIQQLPTTCIKPYNSSSLSIFNSRAGVIHPSSPNMLDINNDGVNGFIDYGYDIGLHPVLIGDTVVAPTPALKINSLCYGDVEIAKGGGYVSTGNYLEVGKPGRNGSIAVNINAPNKIGQRVTVSSIFPESYPTPPEAYNTQLFVNRSRIKALTVINTSTNANGDQTFVVYGSGRTHINASTPSEKYFIMNDASNSSSIKERFILYGNGSMELNTSTADALIIKDGLANINFKIKNTGHVFAREMQIMAPSMSFPDYVFDKDYKLLNLEELDAYISDKKHLPGFEKAEYYKANGIIASEMFVKQQEKIEELTLYLIELKKEIKELKKVLKSLIDMN